MSPIFRPALTCMALVAAWLLLYVFGGFLKEELSILFGASSYSFSGISSIFTFMGVLTVFTLLAHTIEISPTKTLGICLTKISSIALFDYQQMGLVFDDKPEMIEQWRRLNVPAMHVFS